MRSRSMRLSVILLVSLLVVGTLLLAACGKKTTGTTTPTSTPTTAKYGGTLRIVAQSNGQNIGWPAAMQSGGTFVMSYYETLLRSDNKGKLYGWLAQTYSVAKNRKSITFHIRKGVKFTDGSDLTAAVVKWNLDQYMPTKPLWASVVVVDPSTVRVNFKSWDNSLPASFGDTDPALFIVSKTAYDKHGQTYMTQHPVGTGPFMLVSYATDANAKLVKNPNYWGKDPKTQKQLPYLDGLDFTFTADPSTTLMMAKAKQIDMVITVSPGRPMADYRDLGWRVNRSYESNEVWVPDSAHLDSPWSKLAVREAAEYAVDRATIAQKFGYGYLKAPNQILPLSATAYDPSFALARDYNPAKAKQLLAQAGYPKGFKTTLIEWPGANRDIALAEQQYLLAVGIQATVQYTDFGKWSTYIGPTGSFHNALLEGPDPAQGPSGLGCFTFAVGLYGNNFSKPPQLMMALGAATTTLNPETNLIQALQNIMSKNALLIPLWSIGGGRAEEPYVVADFGTRGSPAFISLETAWLNK